MMISQSQRCCRVWRVELPPHRGSDAGTSRGCRPFFDQPLGDSISAVAGKGISQIQAPSGLELEDGRAYILVKGVWKYLYRAVDKAGKTVDFLLTDKPGPAGDAFLLELTFAAPEEGSTAHAQLVVDQMPTAPIGMDRTNMGSLCCEWVGMGYARQVPSEMGSLIEQYSSLVR